MKKILSLLIIFCIGLFIACKTEEEIIINIIGEDKVEVGCSILLTTDYNKDDLKLWISSDESIAKVIDGMVIGLKEGNVVITLEINGKKCTKEIQVIKNIIEITIEGINIIKKNEKYLFKANLSKETNEKIIWTSSDTNIIKINDDGLAEAINIGNCSISASVYDNISVYQISVVNPDVANIFIEGVNSLEVEQTAKLTFTVLPKDAIQDIKISCSDNSLLTIDNDGNIKALKEGKVFITVSSVSNPEIISKHEIEILPSSKSSLTIEGSNEMMQGEHNNLSLVFTNTDISQEVIWKSSDPKVASVYFGIVQGITSGNVVITATSVIDESLSASIEIKVNKLIYPNDDNEFIKKADEILSKMTLEQKVGQMFVVGFNGTNYTNTLNNAIEQYHFGNIIYMGANVTDINSICQMSNDIQINMLKNNLIPAFISTDQEGGRVVRLKTGATHFISNMAMAATNNFNNTYLQGVATGMELRSYGINTDFSPVVDVNNNPENPVIGTRSYSDNPMLVSLYGVNMLKGLLKENVMGCCKHFPGHGNTSTDSHYGLPTINTTRDELYQIELAPFISAIANGLDAIMTTHIIFSAIDKDYPATLSYNVLTKLLREEIGYQGLIVTDGMEMAAIKNYFGDYDQTAVLAVKAGVDLLTYTTLENPKKAYNGLIKAIENKQITEERINESVKRILVKKIKYGIDVNYLTDDINRDSMLSDNEELLNNLAVSSLTNVIGDFNGLDKEKSTLIISPTSSFQLDVSGNSFSCYAKEYLKMNGHNNVECITVNNKVPVNMISELVTKSKQYNQIVLAFSNVKSTNLSSTANLVNEICKINNNVIVIALETPYDNIVYNNVNNYICVYGYQKATVMALSKFLNGEFEAVGKLPVKIK